MIILGLGHQKRVGKDFAGSYLAKKFKRRNRSLDIKIMKFATPLKEIAHQLWGYGGLNSPDYYEDYKPEKKEETLPKFKRTPRDLYKALGRHVRMIEEDTWLECLFHNANCDLCIITDLRFPNEFEAIRKRDGLCIKVDAPQLAGPPDDADLALAHKKDDEWDKVLYNHGTKEEFYIELDKFLEEVGKQ